MAIRISELELVEAPCPLCGLSDGREWGQENGFSAVKCAGCGLVYVTPRPDDSEINAATMTGQHRGESEALSFVYTRSIRKVRNYRKRIRRALAKATPQRAVSWLDIGAGFGELVEALETLLPPGSKIMGIEPMVPKTERARARGLPVQSIEVSEIADTWDFVSLINILSHLPDPIAFLRQLRPLLKPTGTLVLVTGNGGDLGDSSDYPDRLDLPDHLIFAGRRHVEAILAAAGFRLEATYPRRVDTLGWSMKQLLKRLLGRNGPVVIPYRSPFRDVLYLASLRA